MNRLDTFSSIIRYMQQILTIFFSFCEPWDFPWIITRKTSARGMEAEDKKQNKKILVHRDTESLVEITKFKIKIFILCIQARNSKQDRQTLFFT